MLKRVMFYIRKFIKNIFGENIFIWYHYCLAILASNIYGNPSKKMYVVVVTGTKGKTSTENFLWHVLTNAGYKVGLISTANIKIGEQERLNWYHMTMPGRFLLQKLLKEMYDAKCDIVLVEATSEGIKMNRHVGLYYDVAVFTNLFPEHLKSHNNSFQEYKRQKGRLFENLMSLPQKKLPKFGEVEKVIIVNGNDKESEYFLSFPAQKKYIYRESDFESQKYEISLLGKFNILNAMPAILLGKHLGVEEIKVIQGVKNCTVIPGRMEIINEGQDFTAIVDYAHEEVSMRLALEAARSAKNMQENKVVVVFGADGGGREDRTGSARAVSELADVAIVTLSDPFDTDPQILNDFLIGKLEGFGMKKNQNCFEYLDRREAIKKAVSLATTGDVLLFTCKGAEQTIVFKDRVEAWDDRVEVRKAIKNILNP